jgi:hypothetical protein
MSGIHEALDTLGLLYVYRLPVWVVSIAVLPVGLLIVGEILCLPQQFTDCSLGF